MYRSLRVVGRSSSDTTQPVVDLVLREHPAHDSRFRVAPDAADQPHLGPQRRNIVATLAAPPSRCSRWSARKSGTGASWLIRSAYPQM